jgi:hypothetical protein
LERINKKEIINRIYLDSEKIKIICTMYTEGKGTTNISNKFGVSYKIILRILRENNIVIRNKSEYIGWNKGLTAKTDERVKRNGFGFFPLRFKR